MTDNGGQDLDRLLAAGFAERGFIDSRDRYRARLRELKATQPAAFRAAVDYFENTVRKRITAGDDPIDTWIEYGGMLAGLTDEGTLLAIDATGRAGDYTRPARGGQLILFVPETGRNAFIAAQPDLTSPAQQATIDLLVDGRLALS